MSKLLTSLALCALTSTATAQIPCYESNLGTALSLADDGFSAPLPLGFTFNYGGVAYTDVTVGSNGYVVFGTPTGTYCDLSPTVAELISEPEARVCLMWRDLDPAEPGSGLVHYNAVPASGGTPAYFVITYDGVWEYFSDIPLSAQLILIEGDLIQMWHGPDVVNGTNNWLVGASPGNGATANPVQFSSLPIVTVGNPTLHELGTGPLTFSNQTMNWLPDGTGGFVVTPAGGCATTSTYGHGCNMAYHSFYEYFAMGPHDLAGTSLSMIYTGTGYLVTPGATALRGPGTGTALTLTDDSEALVSFTNTITTMPIPGGTTGQLAVCSNGFVSVGTGNQTGYSPTAMELLSEPMTAWYCWTDLNPATTGSGQVYFEETLTHAYVIYDGVYNIGSTNAFYLEYHFEKVTGNVEMVFGPNSDDDDILIGFSVGGQSTDPGGMDLSDPLAFPLLTYDVESIPLALASDQSPVIGTTVTLEVSEIPASSLLAAVVFGRQRYDPGLPLSSIGMPGCFQYCGMEAVALLFPSGASTATHPFTVPNDPGLVGQSIRAQGAAFDPAGGHNSLGALSSNGVELTIGN